MNLSKLTLLTRALSILRVIIICLMIFLVGVLLILLINPSWLQTLYSSGNTLNFDGLMIEDVILRADPSKAASFLTVLAVELIIIGMIALYMLKQLFEIVSCIKEEKPFLPQVTLSMRHLAWLSLIMILVQPVLNGLIQFMFLRQFDFSQLLAPGIDYSVRFEYTIEVSQLIIPLFLFVLCTAFKYGQKLQEFSDSVI